MIDESQNFRRFSLTAHMHGNGINMRHLGRVRSHVTDRGLKVLLLSEMVARVAKQILRYGSGSNWCLSHISIRV